MNWTNAQFEAVLDSSGYKMAVQSWLDQRNYLSSAVNLLEQSNDDKYAQLAKEMKDAMQSTAPSLPDLDGFVKVDILNKTFSCQGISYTLNADMSVSIVAEQKDASNSHHNLGLYTKHWMQQTLSCSTRITEWPTALPQQRMLGATILTSQI